MQRGLERKKYTSPTELEINENIVPMFLYKLNKMLADCGGFGNREGAE